MSSQQSQSQIQLLFTKPRLRKLLDSCENANKEDVRTYCSGHLNPRFLAKLPTEKRKKFWKSANKYDEKTFSPSSSTTSFPSNFKFMKKSDFTQKEASETKQKDEKPKEEKPNKLKEELKLPEIMLPPNNSLSAPSQQDHSVEASLTRYFEKHEFLTTYLAGVTNKDQYQKMLDFDKKVLQTPMVGGKGAECIRHLEEKLIGGIINLQKSNPKHQNQRFKKLTLHAAVWNDITQDSAIYGEILAEIKTQYDMHLTNIIEMTKDNNHSEMVKSYQLINDLSVTRKADDYEEIKLQVEDLSHQCQQALLKNSDLHAELEELMKLSSKEKEDRKNEHQRLKLSFSYWRTNAMQKQLEKQIYTNKINSKKNSKSQLRDLRSDLITELDILEREKHIIKTEFYPKKELQLINEALKEIVNDVHKIRQKINITLVLNMEKKKNVLDLIDFAKSHGINDFCKIEKEVKNMEMVPEGVVITTTRQSTEGSTDLRNSLVRPDLVEEFTRKMNAMKIDL